MSKTKGENSRSGRLAAHLLSFLEAKREAIPEMLILTHDYPDPDALAAAFALQHLLAQGYEIKSRIAYGGVVGRQENRAMVELLELPAYKLRATDFERYEHVALVDTQPRFENNPFPASERKPTLIVDQHKPVSSPDAELALIDTGCGASCVIVARALLIKGIEIPKPVATALAYGILSDTQDLYRANRRDVVNTYLEIIHNCDMHILAKIRNPVRKRGFFSGVGRTIEGASAYRGLLVSHLGEVHNPDLVAQMADFLLTYENSRWAFCTGRYDGRLYLSLRSDRGRTDAGEVLRSVVDNPRDAGGHGTVGGGSFALPEEADEEAWKEAETRVQARLAKRLRIPARGEFRNPFKR
ncbi:hypothetical protein ABI59_12445 [Acidobacteria bacterium Mor1]|nr:hypothetical protein ABI59_12445 [Acidobacteria bacterium Mor1]